MIVPKTLFGRQLMPRVTESIDRLLKYNGQATITDVAELIWHQQMSGTAKNEQFNQLRKRVKDCVDGLIKDMYHYHMGKAKRNQPQIIITAKKEPHGLV